jgi:DNA-binding response OmpR family regulator
MKSKILSSIICNSLSAYGFLCETKQGLTKEIGESTELIIIDTCYVFENIITQKILKRFLSRDRNSFVVGIVTNGKWEDRIEFLKKYGQDVLNYPFPLQELLARIQVLYRKQGLKGNNEIQVGQVRINTYEHKVFEKSNEVPLCKKEYVLLEYMARNKNRAISRSELLDHIWDYKRINSSNTVDVHINRLRKKIENKKSIKTIHGFGYRFDE